MNRRDDLRAKFRGTLLGGAIGDAFGAPFEGQIHVPREAVQARLDHPDVLRYTDDTHMTIGVAESLVACGGFDGHHLAWSFARNYADEPWRGYGSGPPQVFSFLQAGVPWDSAAQSLFNGQGSLGNGAAMRVAPVALFAGNDLEQVALLTRQTANITHSHVLGVEGAVLQACAIALLLQHPPNSEIDLPRFLETLYGLVASPHYCQRLDGILALRDWT